MNQEYAVLYNRSLECIFGNQARAVAKELNCPCLFTDQLLFLSDEEIPFRKCVYFDKDVITGLRLELLGIRLYNNIGSIELCDDKRRTGELLCRDLKVPKTIPSPLHFTELPDYRRKFVVQAIETLGLPLVAKLAFGSLGQQVRLIQTEGELHHICEEWQRQPYLLQEYIPSSSGKDVRIYVVGGQVIAAMERHNQGDFRSNIGAGGQGKRILPPPEFSEAALNACSLLGLDFGGVDLLYGPDGEPILCEVNSNALFRELNQVCSVNIEKNIAETVQKEQNQPLDFISFSF